MKHGYRFMPLVLIAALGACDDTLDPDGTPPELPSAESMSLELDFFDSSPAAMAAMGPAQQATPEANWLAAALSVTAANISVAVHTFVPRAIWAAALSQTPTFEDDQWHWRFDATYGQETFQSHVIGYEDDGDRVFEVRISSSAAQLDDFLLFTGTAPIGGTMGTWTFNDIEGGSAVADVEWSHPETDEWVLTFSALAGQGQGDVLEYSVDGSGRSVSFEDASESTEVVVEWDAVTNVGSILAPNFNGGVRACWDTNLANTDCPA